MRIYLKLPHTIYNWWAFNVDMLTKRFYNKISLITFALVIGFPASRRELKWEVRCKSGAIPVAVKPQSS